MLGGVSQLFANKADHPLDDERELRRVVAELPKDNAFKALDEVAGWFESLAVANDFPADRLFTVLSQLDEAAQPHVRRLTRDYLHSPRLSKTEEKRLWTILHGFWLLLAAGYDRCLDQVQAGGRLAERLHPHLSALLVRQMAAQVAALKWEQFHYGPARNEIWQALGRAYLMAVDAGLADKAVKRYSHSAQPTSPGREYLKALVFHSSSMDCLLPLEIELAKKLITHLLPGFVFSAQSQSYSVYWVDPTTGLPPQRLAKAPAPSASLRFFHAGNAGQEAEAMAQLLERGGELPAEVDLGAQYSARTLLPVLHHLMDYWRPLPPQRLHQRHRVKHRVAVLGGLVNSFVVFSSAFGIRPAGLPIESWVVDNVSRGGFGAEIGEMRGDWVKVGALLALQPEGGDNWLLGIVRRYQRDSETQAHVGIETLARQAVAIELKPRAASSYAAAAGIPGLWLQDGNEAGEVRLVMAPASFDVRESLEFEHEGRRYLLTPVALVENSPDYELARYRLLTAE